MCQNWHSLFRLVCDNKCCITAITNSILFSTGETPWIHQMIKKYHETAQKTGAIVSLTVPNHTHCLYLINHQIIPSCGFDSVPADLSTFAVVDYIRTKLSSRTARLDYSVHEIKGGVSGGTAYSAMRMFDQYSLSQLSKLFASFSLSPRQPNRTYPPKKPSLMARIFGLRKVAGLGWVGVGPQSMVDQCYINRSWGLVADNEAETYGENFDCHVWVRVPGPVSAILLHFTMLTAVLLFCMPPIRWLIKKVGFSRGDGPSLSFREKCTFAVRTSAIADNAEGQQVIGNLRVYIDPYTFTGVCLGEAALLLARDTAIEARLKGGILTTSRLGRTFLESLERNGAKMEVKEVV